MGSRFILVAGTLAAALMIAALTTSEEAPTWRTDLAAAMAEARRTNRPLLAVFC